MWDLRRIVEMLRCGRIGIWGDSDPVWRSRYYVCADVSPLNGIIKYPALIGWPACFCFMVMQMTIDIVSVGRLQFPSAFILMVYLLGFNLLQWRNCIDIIGVFRQVCCK